MTTRSRQPRVTVVIPAYNSERFIPECMESVYSQQGGYPLDVIVVDDGSTDGTVDRIRGQYPLRCLTQANRGPAAARNAALEVARGEYVAFLDSDDIWPPGKLERQLELLESHPHVGMVFGDCRQFDDSGPFPETLFESGRRDEAFWGDPLRVRKPYAKLMEGNFVTTGSVVMRRECVEQVGRFDEGLRLVEDLEYWLRVALGYPIAHVDEVCLLRRRHGDNTSRDQVAMSRAFLRVLEDHHRRYGDSIRAQGAPVARRIAREYQELGHLYARRGLRTNALRAYFQALIRRPGPRNVYYLGAALAARAKFGKADP